MSKRKPPHKERALPICGLAIDEGVDIGVLRHIDVCTNLLDDCARWLGTVVEPTSEKEEDLAKSAQRALLLNFGWCLRQAVAGMTVLLKHGSTGGVLILERSTIEYYGRASYYLKEPQHALWTVLVERLQVLIDRAAGEKRTALIREMNQARNDFAHLTPESRLAQGKLPFHKVKILDMIRRGLGDEAVQRYRSASLVLHGNLYSSELMGRLADEAMNGAVLEAASGLIAFSHLMLSWLARSPSSLAARLVATEEETARLAKRYERAYVIARQQ